MSVEKYIEQLNEQEKQVLQIATSHLEDSFDIERSIGYLDWKEKNKQTNTNEYNTTSMSTSTNTTTSNTMKRPKKKRRLVIKRPT